MSKIKSIFIFLFITISVYSQSNFQKGYLITNSNDTIFGLIDFSTDLVNSKVCIFKNEVLDSIVYYSPKQIAGYRIDNEGKYYVSRIIEVDKVKIDVFLEFLVQGIINLYYYPKGNDYYFFETPNGELYGVTKAYDYIIPEENPILPGMIEKKMLLKTDKKYLGVLAYVFKDDKSLKDEIPNTEFSRSAFIKITKKYHENVCKTGNSCVVFENNYKKKYNKYNFTAFSGFEINDTKITKGPFANSNSSTTTPILGFALSLSNNRLINGMGIFAEATVSKVDEIYDFIVSNKNYVYTFNGMKINYAAGLEYIYQKGKFRPSFNAGISQNNFFIKDRKIDPVYYTRNDDGLTQQWSWGLKLGLGVDYLLKNNHFIVLKMLLSRNANDQDNNNTYQLRLGYKF